MIYNHETETAAQNELYQKKSEMLKKKCPVFKSECLGENCMSFANGRTITKEVYIKETKVWVKKWAARSPSCDSPFVTGYIEAEMAAP